MVNTHPTPEYAQLVDRVEGLGTAAHLHHRQGFALGRADRAQGQRHPVDLRFEHRRHRTVSFRGTPDLAFRPLHQFQQLLHLRMLTRGIIG